MAGDAYSELVLRFEAPQLPGGPYRVEAIIDGMGLWTGGEIALVSSSLDDAPTPALYGANLWRVLTSASGGWPELEGIFSKAWGAGEQLVRLRFMLDVSAPDLHRIKWELLLPDSDIIPIGVNPRRPASRFMPLPSLAKRTSGSGLNILLAIANPSNLKPPFEHIDVEGEVCNLLDVLQGIIRRGLAKLTVLPGRTGISEGLAKRLADLHSEIVPGSTTGVLIGKQMSGKHVLHLVAHGDFRKDAAILLLENDSGELDVPKAEEIMTQWTNSEPRLVVLQSCRSDPQDKSLPAAGLGPSFLKQGVPAVVAMRDFVAMEGARKFVAGFYRKLLDTGEVDVAVNSGRNETYRLKSADWSIPILYSRLRSGERLWEPDSLRQSIQSLAETLRDSPEVRQPFPLEVTVIKNVDAVRRELDQPTSTARVDAVTAAKQELGSDLPMSKLTVLLGGRGRAKSSLLRAMFADLAESAALKDTARPILVRLGDCGSGSGPDEVAALCQAWSKTLESHDIEAPYSPGEGNSHLRQQLKGDSIYLLVDGDDDIGQFEVRDGIDRLKRFLQGANRSALLTMDEAAFDPSFFDREQTTVLIVQDLRADTLRRYLDNYRRPDRDDSPPLPNDIKTLLTGSLRDLAGIPWLLSRILELAELDPQNLQSRFRVLARIVRERLAQVTSVPGGQVLARNALQDMAWRLHSRRAHHLSLAETYSLLSSTRGSRDFPLDSFRKDLLSCKLLVISGPEGVRFAYSAAHSYFTACYLDNLTADDREERLREIVAGLGRLERLRLWQEVLLLLAGDMDQPDKLLRLLMELGFGEGEHLLLAARCVNEARSVGKPVDAKLVSQLTDSLIWWSSPRSGLPSRSRRRAVEAFGYLFTDSVPNDTASQGAKAAKSPSKNGDESRKRIISHLLRTVLDRVRSDGTGQRLLDYSNVRLEALSLLFRHQSAVLQFLSDPAFKDDQRSGVSTFIETWKKGDLNKLAEYLNDEKNSLFAGLAAFALVTWDAPEGIQALRERFHRLPIDDDLHWLMIDGLTELQSLAAIDLVRDIVENPEKLDPALTKYVVYAIGKLGSAMAESKEMEFLEKNLKSDDVRLQALALRACAEILGTTLDERTQKLRDVCHHVLRGKYGEAQRLLGANENRRLSLKERLQLTNYTLDALGHIGDSKSLDVLREFYLRPANTRPNPAEDSLRRTSWEVAETIRLRSTFAQENSETPYS